MSYAEALGVFEPWSCISCHFWSASEVYVFRTKVTGAKLRDATDVLPFISAFGQGQDLRLDVRGAAVWNRSGESFMIDLIGTTDFGLPVPLIADGPADIAKHIEEDPEIRAAFPQVKLSDAQFGPVKDAKVAVDRWLALPILWDRRLPGKRGKGGPTASFATPAEYSIVLGKADDAKATPWKIDAPGLGPGREPENDVALWLLGAAVAGVAGWALWRRMR